MRLPGSNVDVTLQEDTFARTHGFFEYADGDVARRSMPGSTKTEMGVRNPIS